MSELTESRRDEVREHQRRRIRALEDQVEGLHGYRRRLEATAGLLGLALARGDERLSAQILIVCEELAAATLPAPPEPAGREGDAESGLSQERFLEALRS